MGEIILLLFALVVVMLVGHALWLLMAWFFRMIFALLSPAPERRGRPGNRCPRCGAVLTSWDRECPGCGLGRDAPHAIELDELATVSRRLHALVVSGNLAQEVIEPVLRALRARRDELMGTDSVQAVVPLTRLEQLECWLLEGGEASQMPAQQRGEVLHLYELLHRHERDRLTVPALVRLARLYTLADQPHAALGVYRSILTIYPEHPQARTVALEAGEIALEHQRSEAPWFLGRAEPALARPLLAKCTPPALPVTLPGVPTEAPQEGILEALPFVEAAEEPQAVPPAAAPAPVPVPIRTPAPPRQPLTMMLTAFMEQRNILWGELVGGLLIVGCSIALVITLWRTLEAIPYFPFLVFASVTTALFLAGKYTLHHWKLESTSRGLLIIAVLLVPLNLLVLADPDQSSPGPLRLGVKLAALLLLGLLVRLSGRDLTSRAALPARIDPGWLLALGVAGAAGTQLIAPRLLDLQQPIWQLTLPWMPVACQILACLAILPARRDGGEEGPQPGQELLFFVGACTFAVGTALGFIVSRVADPGALLSVLAAPVAVAGIPLSLAGLRVRTGRPREEGGGGLLAAGTAVAVTGLAIQLAGVILAWPRPGELLTVLLLAGGFQTYLAFRERQGWAHATALPCLALAWLITSHLLFGNLPAPADVSPGPWLAHLLVKAASGRDLALFAALVLLLAEVLFRRSGSLHASSYLAGGATAAGLALSLATFHGPEAPTTAAFVSAIAGAAALGVQRRLHGRALAHLGLGLLLVASMWLVHALSPDNLPLLALVLAGEAALLAALSLGIERLVPADSAEPVTVFGHSARDQSALLLIGAALLGLLTLSSPLLGWTLLLLAVTGWLLALRYRLDLLSWVGSVLLLGSLGRFLVWEAALPAHASAQALLLHALLTCLGGWLVSRWALRWPEGDLLLGQPLVRSGQVTSVLVVVCVAIALPAGSFALLAGYGMGLAVLWLGLALTQRAPGWFTAFQAACTGSVLLVVTAWLEQQPWLPERALPWTDPRCLNAYLIGCGLLALVWTGMRLVGPSWSGWHALAEPNWPALDRFVLGVLVVGHLVLASSAIAPAVATELSPAGTVALATSAGDPTAWLTVAILVIALFASLWDRGAPHTVPGLIVLAASVPVLAARPFAEPIAAASALRWGLALGFLTCSALVWGRDRLFELAKRLGIPRVDSVPVVLMNRALLYLQAVVVFLLTCQVAQLGFAGEVPSGPEAGSLFARMGWTVSNIVPLVLLAAGLVGHALRERSPGDAFAAGLLVLISAVGGRALSVVTAGQAIDVTEQVRLLHLGTVTASVWAIVWLISRRWFVAWREEPESDTSAVARPLMHAQLGLGVAGNLLALCPAVALLLGQTVSGPFVHAAGSGLGWLALLTTLGAFAMRTRLDGRPVSWEGTFVGTLALAALGACSVEGVWLGSGHPFLMFSLAGLAMVWALAALVDPGYWQRWLSRLQQANHVAALYLLAGSAVLLASQTAFAFDRPLPAAVATALVVVALAVLAAAYRMDHVAFLAAQGANLAVIFALLHAQRVFRSDNWVIGVQAILITSALAALLWQIGRRRLSGWSGSLVLLGLQVVAPLALHTLFLGLIAIRLLLDPGSPLVTPGALWSADYLTVGLGGGWLTLGLTSATLWWHLTQIGPRGRLSVLAFAGLSVGVLAACLASPWDTGNWLSFHVLELLWCMAGLALVGLGTVAFSFRVAEADREQDADPWVVWFTQLFPALPLRRWVEATAIVLVVVALRGSLGDPLAPYPSAAVLLQVSVMMAALAIWFQRTWHSYASGLLLNAIAWLGWLKWGEGDTVLLLVVQAMAFATAGLAWSVPALALAERWPLHRAILPYAHLACALAVLLLVVVVPPLPMLPFSAVQAAAPLAWMTVGLVGLAAVVAVWDSTQRAALPALYVWSLAVAGLLVGGLGLSSEALWRAMGLALAAHILLVAALAGSSAALQPCWERLRLPRREETLWLYAVLCLTGLWSLGIGVWTSVTAADLGARLVGPGSIILLGLAAAWLGLSTGPRQVHLRQLALVLGVFAAAAVAWAVPAGSGAAVWLERNVLLLVACLVLALVYQHVLPRVAILQGYAEPARQVGAVLEGIASLVVLLVFAQELALYDRITRQTPLSPTGVALLSAALLALMVAGIRHATVPESDPLRMSERGRTLYVYGVEVLLVLLFVHLRLNVPWLFRGLAVRYWTLIVMAIAYVGVGLGELFERRGQRVLAGPLQRTGLFLPLVPLIAFWVRPPALLLEYAESNAPGLLPMLDYLNRLPIRFDQYALLWFLASGLFILLAMTRQSFFMGLIAAVTANCGLWALLSHHEMTLLAHPQMWLIPVALIVLVSEHINRDRLAPATANSLRYFGITLMYVSSTAEMLIAGLGRSFIFPVVLALLSVAGVLAGIVLRVRAFLFLGVSFLCVDLAAMIWHAAVNEAHTWVWWVSGIFLGVAVMALFGLFEKRRNEVLQLLDTLKKWD